MPRSNDARKTFSRFALAALLGAAMNAGAQEHTGSVAQGLTRKNVEDWTARGNVVPVCWDTPGYEREKTIIRDAVRGTWEWFANIQFTGWGACPIGGIGGSTSAKAVRVRILGETLAQSAAGSDGGASGSTRCYGTACLSSYDDHAPRVTFVFVPGGAASAGRVEYVGVHEFGHVLTFVHEQDTPGNVEGPAYCKSPGNEPNSTSLTPYDLDSIMNYCNRDGNTKGNLSDLDVKGVQALYGVRRPNVASRNSCASASVKQSASVAWGWNDGAQTSFALFGSSGTKFSGPAVVSPRQGGWSDDVKWFAGDFSGSGRTDVGGAWNHGGATSIAVRQFPGLRTTVSSWAIDAAGWNPSAIWLPGDFNGDGRTDVAAVWNDGGQVSIAVYLSDGTRFAKPVQWSVRNGGWADDVKWFTGDFNGDGRTDIGAAWNNKGATTLTIRQSTGAGFVPVHWSLDAGDWSDASVFVAGDFNGDGLTDVARLWNDLGRNTTSVSLSTGSGFGPSTDWSVRDGGWILGDAVKWFAGDFNGDGRADIGAAWNDGTLNTLTVRRSTGSAFVPVQWAIGKGSWKDTATWCAGRFPEQARLVPTPGHVRQIKR